MTEDITIAPPRTWEELRTEVQRRTDAQVYPMTGARGEDVRIILGRIDSLDDDAWGRSWSAMAREWFERGQALEATDRKAAADAFIMAWRYGSFGAWPSATSPEKRKSLQVGLDAFARYGRLQAQPIERIEVRFEGGVIPILLQLPSIDGPAPVMLSLGGLDSFKEYVAERYGPVYMKHKIGWVGLDAPNTGETKLLPRPGVEKAYSAVIDYLLTRKDVDASRIGLQGVSMGGYWATRFAFAEPKRLKLAVNWAGPLDAAWAPRQIRGALSSKEYLFGLPAALLAQSGWSSLAELVERQQELSIVTMGLVDKPTPQRMLIVNGLKDSLVPASDTMLLLQHGTPKSAWINPEGIHLARSAEWNDERIKQQIIMPWIVDAMAA
ncbi:alpha/beta hydrolase [Ramlibacter sp. XY19]|uniref:alpha/beta hydrolase family protein n=1 Tax=Ramlibacter paludis TaxID=2908000 RepID=UPI0023D9A89F|nr:alpha/beta hydrolase [Ramlibacter paludis]MCG2591443.1 alpha/beta hydrolase [Ramlibacter paludis]